MLAHTFLQACTSNEVGHSKFQGLLEHSDILNRMIWINTVKVLNDGTPLKKVNVPSTQDALMVQLPSGCLSHSILL